MIPGQLDLVEMLADQEFNGTLRALYVESSAVYDTEQCRDGDHLVCTGCVDVVTGDTVGQLVQRPTVGPCRCYCHD